MIQTSYKEMLVTIIQSLDLINAILKNHHRRTAVISYHLGRAFGFNQADLKLLVMAASVHDLGALSVLERDQLLILDVENPEPHAIMGAAMLEGLPFFDEISVVVRHHHLKWRDALLLDTRMADICSVLHLSDRIDILSDHQKHLKHQYESILSLIEEHVNDIFSPKAIEAFKTCGETEFFWLDVEHMTMQALLDKVLDGSYDILMDYHLLNDFSNTLAKVIDYRSPFTATHSQGVSAVAHAIAQYMKFDHETCEKLKIAGLLHDIGKIGVTNEIINKNGSLTTDEFEEMKTHTYYTYLILSGIKSLNQIATWASSHHEKQDGTGYPFKLSHHEVGIEATVLAYADVFTALSEVRPYRDGLPLEEVLLKLQDIFVSCEYPRVYETISLHAESLNQIRAKAQEAPHLHYEKVMADT